MASEADVAWYHLAVAEAEHDLPHACRAVAVLVALGELAQRTEDKTPAGA